MAINVDTGAVINAASEISKVNKKLESDFTQVKAKVKTLDGYWDGSASEKVLGAFDSLTKNVVENRAIVFESFASFLRSQVGENYEAQEAALTSAASAFK